MSTYKLFEAKNIPASLKATYEAEESRLKAIAVTNEKRRYTTLMNTFKKLSVLNETIVSDSDCARAKEIAKNQDTFKTSLSYLKNQITKIERLNVQKERYTELKELVYQSLVTGRRFDLLPQLKEPKWKEEIWDLCENKIAWKESMNAVKFMWTSYPVCYEKALCAVGIIDETLVEV